MLLNAKADVNAQGGEYGNALQAASWRGSAEVVKMLLDAKADVNTPRGEYGNALQAASWRGSAEVVKMLLDAKADVNAQGGRFGNALQAASYKGSAEVVKMLLDGKADVNAQGGEYGNALLAAVHAAFFFQINILLQAGADPSLFDSLHRSPIHIAASKSLLPLLRQFPVFSFAINAQDIFLRTPLHLAVLNGHLHFALALLELGADPLLQDGYGRNILDWAADFPRLVAQLHHLPSSVMPTDYQKQRATVRQSIHQISNTLLCCIPDPARPLLPLLQQLGHYLLFLDDTDNARSILSFNFNNEDLEVGAKKNLNCDICDESIHGMRVVCRVCVTLNFCLSCTRRYPTHRRWNSHKVHEIFEVPYEPPSDFYPTMEHFSALLQRLARQFGGIPELDNKSMIVDSLPPKTRPDLPMPRGPHSLTTYLLFGLLVTSLCTWHFFHRK
jgi:ankyrin repeat protein